MQFLLLIFICQYHCDHISWLLIHGKLNIYPTCSTVDREEHNKCEKKSYLPNMRLFLAPFDIYYIHMLTPQPKLPTWNYVFGMKSDSNS